MTFPRPSDEACERAEPHLHDAASYIECIVADDENTDDDREKYWSKVLGSLQDGLAELGFDLVPLKQQPPATAEALQYTGEVTW